VAVEVYRVDSRLLRWMRGSDRGASSETIAIALSGLPTIFFDAHFHPAAPRDIADFGRCHRLLAMMGWRDRLPEVVNRFKGWEAYVAAWPKLEELFEAGDEAGIHRRLWTAAEETRAARLAKRHEGRAR